MAVLGHGADEMLDTLKGTTNFIGGSARLAR